MTEKEAKTNWCPLTRHVAMGFVADQANPEEEVQQMEQLAAAMPHNRMQFNESDNRFGDDPFDEWNDDVATLSRSCGCIGSHCMMWRWDTPGEGYCGLAGKPFV